MIATIARVEENELTESASRRRYGRLRLRIRVPIAVQPGQFAMIRPHAGEEPLLRRAMAFHRADRQGDHLLAEFIYQIVGRGTEALARLRINDEVDLLGPLGNTFDLGETAGTEALLVAGGAGSPALHMLAGQLNARAIPTRFFIGGASSGDLCALADFIELLGAERVTTATIDGSRGVTGFVTAPLEAAIARLERPAVIYACGPDPMLHRVARIAAESNLPAQLSLEAPMACGFGICVGCAVPVRHDCPEGFIYQKVCTDGPVFRSETLAW
jgi:dihydroorotate dehydrogenase electron transfer subunit